MNQRVSTLELFFDLVFVFTITQLTTLLAVGLDARALVQVLLMLGVIWWMYGGYAWVTNTVTLHNQLRRGLLITAMCGFQIIALAVPGAFGDDGLVFGLGYLVVTLVHTFLLAKGEGPGTRAAIARLGPLNLASALLVLTGGLLPVSPWRYIAWSAAFVLQVLTPYLRPGRIALAVRPEHFVERHGLVMIIALGESVVAIGVGAAGLDLGVPLIAAAVLGLILAYHLWWCYFGGDDTAAEHAMTAMTDPRHRSRVALHGYGYAHYPMLLGVVALAAGVKNAMHAPTAHAHLPAALALSGGVAVFLLGESWFRRILHIGRTRWRLLAAAAALAAIPLGLYVSSLAQLAALPVILAATFTAEARLSR
ncbi:low temperature requirement protein A [Actinorhabdospora filicis]|uniref:low temperature requirement protein A n=1 Tax=Actinorhabdospora filicis TaxID=1785913 RepID=UPI0025551ED4|nr:low temperature requirement protein A [Actinorhabdospora filicis]